MYIPKLNTNKKRPLGIPEHEDKIVQKGIAKILNIIFENDFLDCSFGIRPNRNCHDALKILNHYIEKRSVSYIEDVDIKGFFDNADHKWVIEFLKLRISDPNWFHQFTTRDMEDQTIFCGGDYPRKIVLTYERC